MKTTSESSPTPSPRLILAILGFGVFIAADDLTVVSTMLRQIIFDLGIPLPEGLNDAAWIVNAYLIAYVVVMPFVGRLSDIVGRRAVYIGALVLFLAGSLWIPFTTTLPAFLVGRVLTAVGGGAMVPVAIAVIADITPRDRRATALGLLSSIDTAGWVWGPLYGALLVRFLDWRWQFYLNWPLAIIGLVGAWIVLRDLPPPGRREGIDWPGAALLSTALIALNVALLNGSGNIQSVTTLAALQSDDSLPAGPLYALAAVTFLAFIAWQRRRSRVSNPPPLIDLTLFRHRNVGVALAVNFLVGFVLIIAMVNVPLIVNVMSLDVGAAALRSGWLLSALTASMALLALAGGWLADRRGYRGVTAVALLLAAAGYALLGTRWGLETPDTAVAFWLALLGAGIGLATPPLSAAVVNAVATARHGIAAGLVIVLRLLGMSVGLAALTAWGLRRFAVLRTEIPLPDLPFTDPAYQQAIVDGLTAVTVTVLTETLLVSAAVALLAAALALGFHSAGPKP